MIIHSFEHHYRVSARIAPHEHREYEIHLITAGEMDFRPISADIVSAARETLKKKRSINIRLSENDLEAIKLRAAWEGLPYQTLIGSILHKYAAGYL